MPQPDDMNAAAKPDVMAAPRDEEAISPAEHGDEMNSGQSPMNTVSQPADQESPSAPSTTEEVPSEPPPAVPTPKWPLVLFVILLGVALIGGYILYQRAQAKPTPSVPPSAQRIQATPTPQPSPASSGDVQTDTFGSQSKSDETGAIEADLTATDLSKLDAEITEVNRETSGL